MKNKIFLGGLIFFFSFAFLVINVQAADLSERLKGKILLQVEQNGEAWYIHPENKYRYYMGTPEDAFGLMRELGVGISDVDLSKIAIAGESDLKGIDYYFSRKNVGKIFLQVEQNGEAWYVNPEDNKRYFLGRPGDAFNLMRELGLGIKDIDLLTIDLADNTFAPAMMKDCKSDKDCFKEATKTCSLAKAEYLTEANVFVEGLINENVSFYEVKRIDSGECEVSIKIISSKMKISDELKSILLLSGMSQSEIDKTLKEYDKSLEPIIGKLSYCIINPDTYHIMIEDMENGNFTWSYSGDLGGDEKMTITTENTDDFVECVYRN